MALSPWRSVAAAAALVAGIAGCGLTGATAAPPTSSPTATPTNAPSPTAPASESPASPSPAGDGTIPGLAFSDVVEVLETQNVECTEPETDGDEVFIECDAVAHDFNNHVEIRGTSEDAVSAIEARSLSFAGADAVGREFLPLLAGLPCEGCDPAAAREWVADNWESGGEDTFGPLALKLSKDAEGSTLELRGAP